MKRITIGYETDSLHIIMKRVRKMFDKHFEKPCDYRNRTQCWRHGAQCLGKGCRKVKITILVENVE